MKWKLVNEGKVRRVYEDDEGMRVLLVAGDGVSAFNQELGVEISSKGKMLTQISKYWFDQTEMMTPNAYSALKVDPEPIVLPPELRDEADAVTPMLKLNMLPIEAIVRGYITGSLWEAYSKDGVRDFCGLRMPNGLRNCDKLPAPIFTPTTKAPKGEHDRNLSFSEMIDYLEEHGIMGAEHRAKLVRDYSLRLYTFAFNKLIERGIMLADTKFEFGINPLSGNIMLADEIFTPDSSRFWILKDYIVDQSQKSLDKQVIRDWVKDHPGERVPKAILEKTALLYSRITDVMVEAEGARKFI